MCAKKEKFNPMNVKLVYGSAIIIIASTIFIFLQYILALNGLTQGIFVVDAVSLKLSLLTYKIIDVGLNSLSDIISSVFSFYALLIVYYFSSTEYGFLIDFITNLLLTLITYRNIFHLIRLSELEYPNFLLYSTVFWLLNPYLLCVMLFPNKEILLALVSSAFALSLLRRRYIIASLYIFGAYFIRDGHAIALSCAGLAYYLITHTPVKGWQIFIAILIVLFTVSINDLSQFGGAFERNANLGSSGSVYESGPGSNANKLLSIFVNWLNLGFRPQFFGHEGLYFLNIGFWLLGIATFITLPIAFYNVLISSQRDLLSSLLIVSILAALVVSSYSQQRYFLPFLPFMMLLMTRVRVLYVAITFPTSLLIVLILSQLNSLPPEQIGISQQQLRQIGLP